MSGKSKKSAKKTLFDVDTIIEEEVLDIATEEENIPTEEVADENTTEEVATDEKSAKRTRKKKEEPVDLVEEVIRKTKLPVYEENQTEKAFMSIDEAKPVKKTKKSLKKDIKILKQSYQPKC